MSFFTRRQPEDTVGNQRPANDDSAVEIRSLTQTLDAASEGDEANKGENGPADIVNTGPSLLHEHDTLIVGVGNFANDVEEIGDVVASLKDRLPDIRRRAERIRREAAAGSETAHQLQVFRKENLSLEETVTRQAERITDLEAAALASARVQETLQSDLITLQNELDEERQKTIELTKRDQELSEELELGGVRNSKLEAEQSRQSLENTRLTEARSALEKRLAEAQTELSQAQCALAERDLQLERVTESERALVTEQRRGVEDRASLKRESTMIQADLAEANVRIERLKAENDAYVKRLASEQYSMSKDRTALLSEFEGVRQQADATHRDLLAARDEIDALRRERDEYQQRLDDLQGVAATRRDELRSANTSISEISLKYAADMLTLDQLRDENRELRNRIEGLHSESRSLYAYQAKYKSAENRARDLEAKLAEHIEAGAAMTGRGSKVNVAEDNSATAKIGAEAAIEEAVTKH